MKLFIAYPKNPDVVSSTIRNAVTKAKAENRAGTLVSWEEDLAPGAFIGTEVVARIAESDGLVADVTFLNFNVLYEVGYAIGRGRPILLTVNRAIAGDSELRQRVGLIDTLLYKEYENSEELLRLVETQLGSSRSLVGEYDRRQPVYLMDTRYKTDFSTKLASRIRKAKLAPRVFDATEDARMSGPKTIREVVSSYGIVVLLAPAEQKDSIIHNYRAAFLLGLACGLDRVVLAIQQGLYPVPADYVDLVTSCTHPDDISDAVADFASDVLARLTGDSEVGRGTVPETLLERLDLGASSAENEFRQLSRYYLETEEFRKALRGEARLVVGRKGTGKSALFFSLRDRKRSDARNLVLDLKPEGYQLRKLRDLFEIALGEGSYEHTLTAFWDYLLRLELARAVLEREATRYRYDHTKFDLYQQLQRMYRSFGAESAGSFSERLATLITRIVNDLRALAGDQQNVLLSEPRITEIVYGPTFYELEGALSAYLDKYSGIWVLFDNLDKGWPAYGLDDADIIIVRTLLEATRKIERWVHERLDLDCHALIFLRNDVYELLISGTPDRGKESKVLLDWTDSDVLREIVRRRMITVEGVSPDSSFYDIWRTIFTPLCEGEESSQYVIDRCLMRPRFLLDLIGHCKSFAINLGHRLVSEDDIRKGVHAYSSDVLTDISLELRDIAPYAENVLYSFIGAPLRFDLDFIIRSVRGNNFELSDLDTIIELLLWYGFLGLVKPDGEVQFIYNVNYNMKTLLAIRRQHSNRGLLYTVNPAFWSVLEIGD